MSSGYRVIGEIKQVIGAAAVGERPSLLNTSISTKHVEAYVEGI